MALRSISGTLASADLVAAIATHAPPPSAVRAILQQARRSLGPASAARHVFDVQLAPLLHQAGLEAAIVRDEPGAIVATFGTLGRPPIGLLSVGAWGADLRRLRERAAKAAPAARWWVGANGATLRVMDVSRAYARRVLDFDLARAEDEDAALAALHALLAPDNGSLAALDRLIEETASHRVDVGRSLQAGVEDALARLTGAFSTGRRRIPADASFADALTVVYRLLFLLFAEARGLVPQWHPIYRDSYTIESLRPLAEGRGVPAGLWESLQAISRLAHRGCTAGSLRVVPFNGRLFAPGAAPLADSFRLDDRVARDVLLAVTTRPGRDRRDRIAYGDLGVEQLGAVYERVLDYAPGGDRRKGTGTFYTPRAMTEYLVRRTLAPLVAGRSPDQVLALRVLDPAMGSGAFLVAACRYLADAYEEALVTDGVVARADITASDRAAFRRAVAQRCLYGVDVNPTAVQLARLSLWLCTLASDRPLTFLDHHLRAGNSLVGARAVDLARQPAGRRAVRREAELPLFEATGLSAGLASAVGTRLSVARTPDDTAAIVHGKERLIDDLAGAGGPLSAWRACADAWCASWFWPSDVPPLTTRTWPAFSAALQGRESGLPPALEQRWRRTADGISAAQRFFHWELEFPEVFFAEDGSPSPLAGFDAVIGNPPWADAAAVAAFTRESGCYRLHGRGHANLYQLFAERMLQLVAPRGRIGMLMPWGLLADHGCGDLRRHLFERTGIDVVLGFDNREALFPIHRGLRFSLLTATAGDSTSELRTRFGLHSASALEDVPDSGEVPGSIRVPVALIRRFSGDTLAVPELEQERDRAVLARALASAPALGDPAGWNVHFGRELNATDDRPHFGARGLPILEGKHLDPFVARAGDASQFIDRAVARRLLGSRARIDRPRVGYREVASSTNRLTLIAAIIPAGVVTTHTVFCARQTDDEDLQWFLCGMFNSFVANYLARLRGGTHVPAAAIHRLPVPVVPRHSEAFERIAALARVAAADQAARADLHARAALLYGLDADDFAHVLSSFPLVGIDERARALDAQRRRGDAI